MSHLCVRHWNGNDTPRSVNVGPERRTPSRCGWLRPLIRRTRCEPTLRTPIVTRRPPSCNARQRGCRPSTPGNTEVLIRATPPANRAAGQRANARWAPEFETNMSPGEAVCAQANSSINAGGGKPASPSVAQAPSRRCGMRADEALRRPPQLSLFACVPQPPRGGELDPIRAVRFGA